MARSSHEIVKDLLRQANYYWYDDNEDNVRPLDPDDFDPVVDKIFKANAVEFEKLYAEIDESRREVVLSLAKTLVPDQSLLPEPGYTVAQIKPRATRVVTSPEDEYIISGQSDTGDRHEFYFSPLFDHYYAKCELGAWLTEHTAFLVEDNEPERVMELPGDKLSNSLWLGLRIGKMEESETLSFFLGDKIVDDFDKDFYIFHAAKWLLHGDPEKELPVETGIAGFAPLAETDKEDHLLEVLDVKRNYEDQVHSRLRNSFIHITLPANTHLHNAISPPRWEENPLVAELGLKEPLCWIKLEFPLALPADFLQKNILYPNCIPLVNRRLNDNYVVKSNYDRILLPMPTKDHFLDVYKVQDTRNKVDGTSYHRVDFLHPESRPGTYILRSGSRVRRLNREDATRQIHRLLEVIQDEYSTFKEEGVNRLREDFEIIEKAINRVKQQLPDYFRDASGNASYFCIANFRPGVSRLHFSYWETQGEQVKYLGDRTGLGVNAAQANISDSRTVIPIQQGKGEMSADDYLNQAKTSLLSRGRILSRADVEWYCRSRFGRFLEVTDISYRLMRMDDGKTGRAVRVQARPVAALTKSEGEFLRLELQNDLNAKSAFFTPIKVDLAHG